MKSNFAMTEVRYSKLYVTKINSQYRTDLFEICKECPIAFRYKLFQLD